MTSAPLPSPSIMKQSLLDQLAPMLSCAHVSTPTMLCVNSAGDRTAYGHNLTAWVAQIGAQPDL